MWRTATRARPQKPFYCRFCLALISHSTSNKAAKKQVSKRL
ncbi:hypothetical protein SONE68_3001 (plasmid) [Lacticaseibacillus paracasei]|nr:hypothetical protein SONE68_3001 [Lacticaseibacillus paracasei]